MGWGLALLALGLGYATYGWPGVALALTVIIFWLLLQFTRAVRVLREAASRPVGTVDNAVMLHAKLHAGMRLPQILKLTRSLGKNADGEVRGTAGNASTEESFAWADGAGDSVHVQLREGRLVTWTLHRSMPEHHGPGTQTDDKART